jgi:hypothetical protein
LEQKQKLLDEIANQKEKIRELENNVEKIVFEKDALITDHEIELEK